MPNFLGLMFVKTGVSRVDSNKIWVCREKGGIEKTSLGSIEIRKEKYF